MVNGFFLYAKQQMRLAAKWLKIPIAKAPKPQPTFTSALTEVHGFNTFLSQKNCPTCGKKEVFKTTKYERGKHGFESRVICTFCGTTGIVNPTGFQFEAVQVMRGKAK